MQHACDGGNDAGTVGANGGHGELGHARLLGEADGSHATGAWKGEYRVAMSVRRMAGVVVAFAVACSSPAAVGGVPPMHPEIDDWDAARVTVSARDGDIEFAVVVAANPEQHQRGLMHVEHVPEGAGMLFVFDERRSGSFWMKNTLVPLDIAFVADGEVVFLATMVPCDADPCPLTDPGRPYDAALEVAAGGLDGVEVGDGVVWSEPVGSRQAGATEEEYPG